MKLDRLIGILSILLQRERVTAPEPAELRETLRQVGERLAERYGGGEYHGVP